MDLIACIDDGSTCADGFGFDGLGAVFGSPTYTTGGSYGIRT